MINNVIDLRNRDRKENEVLETNLEETPLAVREEREELWEWATPEYSKVRHGSRWFLFMALGATAFIIFGIFTRSYFFVALITLSFIVILMYAARSPREISCAIGQDGIRTGNKTTPFTELKSFWIFKRADGNELSLETKKPLTPFVVLPLGSTDPEKIRRILKNHLPEEEHKELITDQIARALGF